jgi:hypothetical protein
MSRYGLSRATSYEEGVGSDQEDHEQKITNPLKINIYGIL